MPDAAVKESPFPFWSNSWAPVRSCFWGATFCSSLLDVLLAWRDMGGSGLFCRQRFMTVCVSPVAKLLTADGIFADGLVGVCGLPVEIVTS
ncbi:hypothetical protein ACFC09_44390 [Streptomyces sp. NPDC056161]|uniref:hypothetical protein n=1 Tax=Streptomyces sp. NPDC056161 TaxID=3345732 RepID=UPI0035D9220E